MERRAATGRPINRETSSFAEAAAGQAVAGARLGAIAPAATLVQPEALRMATTHRVADVLRLIPRSGTQSRSEDNGFRSKICASRENFLHILSNG